MAAIQPVHLPLEGIVRPPSDACVTPAHIANQSPLTHKGNPTRAGPPKIAATRAVHAGINTSVVATHIRAFGKRAITKLTLAQKPTTQQHAQK